MTRDEIEERVKQSLEALNSDEERYDWRLTHYNAGAWADLQEGSYELSEGRISEDDLKALIKVFRDRSEISIADFHVKIPEPGPEEFDRMALLFGVTPDERIIPPRNKEERRVYMQQKTIDAMSLTLDHKQQVSEKLRQQFNFLMLRPQTTKPPELLAVAVRLEQYNPYAKRLVSPAPITLTNHFMDEPKDTEETPAPAASPMFSVSEGVDNSSFEARLAPSSRKPPRQARPKMTVAMDWAAPGREDITVYHPEPPPHELPAEIHEGFASYCKELYEKNKSN